MSSKLDEIPLTALYAAPTMLTPSPASGEREQENARLRLALREARHRSCNQWQFLIGLADMEMTQQLQTTSPSYSLRLRSAMQAFALLNKRLDTDSSLTGSQQVGIRAALESVLELLQATTEEDALHFVLQDTLLSEKECAALMLICAELVCNATKYGRRRTQVTFRTQAGQGILEVRDDGEGFPAGFRVQEQGGQGLQLVDALCRFDLHGEMRCQSHESGGVVTVTFPVFSPLEATPTMGASPDFCTMEGVICFDSLSHKSEL